MILLGDIFAKFNTSQYEIIIPSSEISFSLIDSIHSLYSKCSLQINDRNGLYSEYLLSTPGNILNIQFGNNNFMDDILDNNFILNQEVMENADESPDRLSGPLDISFLHEFYNYQKIDSKSYSDTIHNIIADLIKSYSFSHTTIDEVSNYDTFYQALRTQSEMIIQDLLPIAYSTVANKTPYFAFINSKNEFLFKSYDSMFSGNSDDSYILQRNEVKYNNKAIIDISRWSEALIESKKYNKDIYTLDQNSVVSKEYLNVKDYFPIPPLHSYPLTNDKGNSYNHEFKYYGDASSDKSKGLKVNVMRQSLFKDRLMILVPFNPKLTAGKTIDINFLLPNVENETFSERSSGKYIIELSEHTWDGQSATAISKFIVSRKYSKIPKTYNLQGNM